VTPGKTEKEAKDAFDGSLAQLGEVLKKELQCDQYSCDEGTGPCSWAYFLDDNKVCKQVHVQPKNKPIWVCEQTGWAGCFCDDRSTVGDQDCDFANSLKDDKNDSSSPREAGMSAKPWAKQDRRTPLFNDRLCIARFSRRSLAACLRFLALLYLGSWVFSFSASAQQTATSQGPPNPGQSFVIDEGETVATATGAQTRVFSTILHPDPTDPTRATDPKTGRNFNWDPHKKSWVNSQTGQSVHAVGCLAPLQTTTTQGPPNPGESFVIDEGETVATVTGAQTRVFSTILHPDPTDPTRAADPKTGRNFNWDPDKKTWVNSQTGQGVHVVGVLLPFQPSTTPTTPETPPKENKTVSANTPPQPGPPKPLISLGVGGGLGFSNIGGTSGDRAAFLNSFPGGTFSTSANTFAGNVGSSIGIGPAVFDFNAWRANGSDSKGSGPVSGGGTDTAHITQQFEGFTLTGGGKIPLGGGVSLILRGGGNFWHVNIDTKETVANGTTSSTVTNSRGVDGRGWTTGAALQWDFISRWSAVARWDHLPMRNAGVNGHLNQFSVGVMFYLFGNRIGE
jgi:hypothetical protein